METSNVTQTSASQQCVCAGSTGGGKRVLNWTTAAGVLAALGVCAACCLLPFTFVGMGIAGAWIGALEAFAPYKWIFVAVAVVLLAYGFYAVYWKSGPQCQAGSACRNCGRGIAIQVGLWLGALLVMSGIAFEYVEPYLAG